MATEMNILNPWDELGTILIDLASHFFSAAISKDHAS